MDPVPLQPVFAVCIGPTKRGETPTFGYGLGSAAWRPQQAVVIAVLDDIDAEKMSQRWVVASPEVDLVRSERIFFADPADQNCGK